MIMNTKNELENISVDVISMIKNNDNINDIKELYSYYIIEVTNDDKYTKVVIKESVDVMTPGLNLILGDPYVVKVERTIPNVKTE